MDDLANEAQVDNLVGEGVFLQSGSEVVPAVSLVTGAKDTVVVDSDYTSIPNRADRQADVPARLRTTRLKSEVVVPGYTRYGKQYGRPRSLSDLRLVSPFVRYLANGLVE